MQSILSAKKTKTHGFKSRRWIIKDKITQYKGLINLNARDKKIAVADAEVTKKKLRKDIINLRKEIYNQRCELENAFKGDKQTLRNTLEEHRDLKLAYQNLLPSKIVDNLYQVNFHKKKDLDKVNFKMKQKTERLIDLKLEYADLEDRIKFEGNEKIPVEVTIQVVIGKIWDYKMKDEAARAINDTYKQVLNLLRRDAIYFDALLDALRLDGYNQGRCIYKVTEMGQMATEYLDDRRLEYRVVEEEIKAGMKQREQALKAATDQLQTVNNNVKYLVRRDDSVMELAVRSRRELKHRLLAELAGVEELLLSLRNTTMVSKIEDIFPRMEEQQRQKERLAALVKSNAEDRDTLLRKSKHAEEMYLSFYHSMVSTTFWYKGEKKRINAALAEQEERIRAARELIDRRGRDLMSVRCCLQHIAEMLRVVQKPEKESEGAGGRKKGRPKKVEVEQIDDKQMIIKPEHCEEDAQKLIALISSKLQLLLQQAGPALEGANKQKAADAYQLFIYSMTGKDSIADVGEAEESLVDDVKLDDPLVPSREAIKAESARIVEMCAPSEEDMVI